MEQALHRSPRTGWREEESDTLFHAVREASRQGEPLRSVFEQVGQTLGRKPNSIRNYYYAQLRQRPDTNLSRAAPFQTFTEDEVHELLRDVLTARSQGMSVRACVMRLAKGDRSLMLRYQNKYRSILKNRPHMLNQVAEELRKEGLAIPDAAAGMTRQSGASSVQAQWAQAQQMAQNMGDPAEQQMLDGLNILMQRACAYKNRDKTVELDRLQVAYDLARMRWEDDQGRLKNACEDMLRVCREFLGVSMSRRQEGLEDFSGLLSVQISQLENVLSQGG